MCVSIHCTLYIVLQMLPLLKKSTDNLVAVMGEMVASEKSFDALKYVNYSDQVFTTIQGDVTI